MIEKLLKGEYTAVVSDDTQLLGYAYADDSCSLHILGDMIEPFDLAFAFRRGFPSDAFRRRVGRSAGPPGGWRPHRALLPPQTPTSVHSRNPLGGTS